MDDEVKPKEEMSDEEDTLDAFMATIDEKLKAEEGQEVSNLI